uniref:Uncharacterized protein n=1 Tax=Schistosoma curassoni TaxID=6186 RepID=A0A183KKN0_9TREM
MITMVIRATVMIPRRRMELIKSHNLPFYFYHYYYYRIKMGIFVYSVEISRLLVTFSAVDVGDVVDSVVSIVAADIVVVPVIVFGVDHL